MFLVYGCALWAGGADPSEPEAWELLCGLAAVFAAFLLLRTITVAREIRLGEGTLHYRLMVLGVPVIGRRLALDSLERVVFEGAGGLEGPLADISSPRLVLVGREDTLKIHDCGATMGRYLERRLGERLHGGGHGTATVPPAHREPGGRETVSAGSRRGPSPGWTVRRTLH